MMSFTPAPPIVESDPILAEQLSNLIARDTVGKLIARDTPKAPERESLADRNCPVCGAGIHWDALNDPIKDAPAFCCHCGQRFDWSKEPKFNDV